MEMNNAGGRPLKVMITGGSRGIGRAIAEIFAANGHSLVLTSRNGASLGKAADELMTKYPGIIIHARAFDLSDKEQVGQAGTWVLGLGIVPDILVNNAGSFEPGGVQNEPDGALERQLATNLYSAYHLTRALLPSMIQQESPVVARHIFNMCSIASIKAYHNGGAYSISKFALYGFTQNLREEMKSHGVKVTAVLPGAVMTDSWEGFDNRDRRIMEAEDIARMVFASSQLSPQACVEDILIRPQKGDL